MRNRRRDKGERYVKLRFWLLDSPAWQSLPPAARALYIEMVKRYYGSNNGRIGMGVRDAAKLIGVSKDTALLAFRFLEDRGFVVCTKRGAFSHKTCKDASEWRLTEYDSDYPVQHATKEFMRRTEFKTRSQILGPSSPKNPDGIVLKNRTAKTKTGLSGPKNSDRKAPKQADHGPKISDTYSYQVGGGPCVEGKDTSLSPMCWATPRVIEVTDPAEKAVIQAFWRPELPVANFSRTLEKAPRL
jgi:hypothetical protein